MNNYRFNIIFNKNSKSNKNLGRNDLVIFGLGRHFIFTSATAAAVRAVFVAGSAVTRSSTTASASISTSATVSAGTVTYN
jgi:hypothetical protein